MAALAAAAAEDPALAHDATVAAAGFRRTGVQGCVHDLVECDRPASFRGARRNAGTDSIAQASDAHDARIARFSFSVRSGSLTTCEGCENACAR